MTSPGGWWQIRQPPQPKHEPCCDTCSEPAVPGVQGADERVREGDK